MTKPIRARGGPDDAVGGTPSLGCSGAGPDLAESAHVRHDGTGLKRADPLGDESTIGLGLLSGLLLWQGGVGTLREMITMARPLHAVPGILGSFFVYASLTGYHHLGAAPTIAILVSSQLMFGLGADLLRGGDLQLFPVLGVMLLIIGSCLVVFGKV